MKELDERILDVYQKTIIEGKKKKLSVPEKHQLNIAKKTLKMSDAGANIMGGMTKKEAREFLSKIGYSDKEIKKMEEESKIISKNELNEKIQNAYYNVLMTEAGKGQEVILNYLKNNKDTEIELSRIASHPSARGVHFGKLQSAAKALKKKGKIEYDNISRVKFIKEGTVFNMKTFKAVEKKLKDQWERVTKGKGASAKFGAWILKHYKSEKELLDAPIEVSDQINNKFKTYKNLKQAVNDFPDLDEFNSGMRGKDNKIRFERSRR